MDWSQKSTIEEIRQRFDADVERFSDLETGQSATMDAPLAMELITQAALASTGQIRRVLDIGAVPATTPLSCCSMQSSPLRATCWT